MWALKLRNALAEFCGDVGGQKLVVEPYEREQTRGDEFTVALLFNHKMECVAAASDVCHANVNEQNIVVAGGGAEIEGRLHDRAGNEVSDFAAKLGDA